MESDNKCLLVDVLYGGQAELRHCSGYCKKKGKYLTLKQMRNKECLAKQCHALDKIESHAFWKHREKKLQEKKQRKIQGYFNTPSFMKDMNVVISMILGFDARDLLAEIK